MPSPWTIEVKEKGGRALSWKTSSVGTLDLQLQCKNVPSYWSLYGPGRPNNPVASLYFWKTLEKTNILTGSKWYCMVGSSLRDSGATAWSGLLLGFGIFGCNPLNGVECWCWSSDRGALRVPPRYGHGHCLNPTTLLTNIHDTHSDHPTWTALHTRFKSYIPPSKPCINHNDPLQFYTCRHWARSRGIAPSSLGVLRFVAWLGESSTFGAGGFGRMVITFLNSPFTENR